MKTKYFIHLSLKSKLTLLFSFLLLLISVFIYIYIPAKREAFSVKAIEEKTQVIGQMIAYSISPAIVFDDKTAVEESFDNARQNKELLYLIVVKKDGQIFKSYNLNIAISSNYKKTFVDFDLSAVKTEIPIYHQSKNIGSLFIGLSLNDVKKEILETRIAIGFLSLIIFLIGLAAVIGISTLITKPLYKFIGTIKEISSGDLGKRVMISTRDEIGLLANSFNEMLLKLQLAYEELGNLNKSLEDRVIERTRELKLSQERYKTLYENTPVMLHSIDTQGRLISVSEFWLSNTGYAREDVIGKKSVDFLSKESREYAEKVVLPDFFKSGSCKDILYQMVKKNGEFIDILLSATSEKDNERNVLRSLAVLVDITEKKKAEEQLLESEERFRSLYENATLGIYRTTPDGKIEMANPALVEMLGYSSFEELAARDLEKGGFNTSYERKYFIEQIEKNEKIIGLESAWTSKGGTVVYIRESAKAIRDSNGKTLYYEGTVEDITEHKRAEEEITFLANALKSVNECVSITDLEDKILFVNESFLKTYGYDENELNGKHISIIRLLNSEQTLVKEILPATKHGGWKGELWNKRKDGSEFQIYLSTTIINDKHGKLVGLIGVATDITKRKLAEETLKKSEESYRFIVESTNAVIYHLKYATMKYDYINPAIERLTGYSPEEINEIGFENIKLKINRNHVENVNIDLFVANREQGKTAEWQTDYQVRTKDGRFIWLSDHSYPWLDETGNLIGSIGILEDITERKRAEKELIEAKEKAEEMSRLKSSFLANMSHELRTPLVGILGFSEILKDELEDSEHKAWVETIYKSGNRLSETLNLILDLSKLESEKMDFKIVKVDVTKETNEIMGLFSKIAERKGLYLKAAFNCPSLMINIDVRAYRSILNNLINNAIKFTNNGGVLVEVNVTDNSVEIKVKDTGIGISKKDHEIIFAEFRQVSEGLDRNFEGSGLGLNITKKLVNKFGGEITVESELDEGSTFMVKLPQRQGDGVSNEKTSAKPPDKQPVSAKEKTKPLALLVDDDPLVHSLLTRFLDGRIQLETIIEGEAAIKICKEKKYDMIFMDINLRRGLDGKQVTGEIRKLEGYESIPIIAFTAYAMAGDEQEFRAAGCSHYISKPFNKHSIVNLVDELMFKKN